MNRTKKYKRIILLLLAFILFYFTFNAIKIYRYSFQYSEEKSDVAIVLGAGTSNGTISPVFRERINHSIYLYNKNIVSKIIFTGGYGNGQKLADSEIAKRFTLNQGIPDSVIIIENKSKYTIENLFEARQIMDSLDFSTALIVTDPIHMKRSIDLARHQNINCQPSPTKTTMYKSFLLKAKSLVYETFYYSLGEIAGKN